MCGIKLNYIVGEDRMDEFKIGVRTDEKILTKITYLWVISLN